MTTKAIEAAATKTHRPNSRALWERLGEIKDHVFSPSEDTTDKQRVVHLMSAAHRIQKDLSESTTKATTAARLRFESAMPRSL